MGPLLLLAGALLAVSRPTHSAGLEWAVRADSDVKINCSLANKDLVLEWRWVPRYPGCVTDKSKEVVIYSPSDRPNEGAEGPFHGRLMVRQNKHELMLRNARVNDSGTFYCIGEGNNKSISGILSVSHDCPPGPTEDSIKLGQEITLSCCNNKLKNQNKNTVRWLLDGQTVNKYLINETRALRSGAITIKTLRQEHLGLWSCHDEEGQLMVELCLEVTAEGHEYHVAVQPTSTPTEEHSTKGAATKPIKPRVVWVIAGVLAAILFILLMIGIYCCLRAQKQQSAESKKCSAAMGDLKPTGRSHGKDDGATGDSKAEPPHDQEGHEEIHYSLLEFHMAEDRAETPRAPGNSTLYSEVSRKT